MCHLSSQSPPTLILQLGLTRNLSPGTDAPGPPTTGWPGRAAAAATCTSCGAPPTTSTSTPLTWLWVGTMYNSLFVWDNWEWSRQPSCHSPVLANLDTFHPASAKLCPCLTSLIWQTQKPHLSPFSLFSGVTTERSDKFNDMYYQKPTWFARKYTYHDAQGIWYSCPELIIHAKTTTR